MERNVFAINICREFQSGSRATTIAESWFLSFQLRERAPALGAGHFGEDWQIGFRSTDEGGKRSPDTSGEEGPAGSLGASRRAQSSPHVVPGLRVAFLLWAGKERKLEPHWALPDPPCVLSSLTLSLAMPDGDAQKKERGPG